MRDEKIQFNMSMPDIVATMSEGNIGAATAIMELLGTIDGFLYLLFCDSYGIRGTKLYILYNDSCHRDINKMMLTLRMIQSGVFSMNDVEACLNLRRAIPFIDDSIEHDQNKDVMQDEDYLLKIQESFRKRLNELQDGTGSCAKRR